jgi:hypothetical protein
MVHIGFYIMTELAFVNLKLVMVEKFDLFALQLSTPIARGK